MRQVLSEQDNIILGIATNKNEEEVVIVQWEYANVIYIMLASEEYKAHNWHPRIMSTYIMPDKEAPYIRIDDIITLDKNVGNGSILMPYFLAYCKKTDAEYIKGELSSVDQEHFDRSEYFYKKFGFDVSFNSERTLGSVRYSLK